MSLLTFWGIHIIMLTGVNKFEKVSNLSNFGIFYVRGKNMISKSNEEYLKTMYILQKQQGNIRVTDIANKMKCTKPSVNKALNTLKENKLIKYEAYGPIKLTDAGEELAKKILEAYDIVYVFLKDVLNVSENTAKEDAERMKSVITDDTINNLAKYVHKVLELNSLDCDYDINKERCRSCVRRTLRPMDVPQKSQM